MSYMEPIWLVGLTYHLDAQFVEVKRTASSHALVSDFETRSFELGQNQRDQLAYALT